MKNNCEICYWPAVEGKEYPFYVIEILSHYSRDRVVSSSATKTVTSTQTTTRYRNYGATKTFVCNRCILKKSRNDDLIAIGVLFILALAASILSYFFWDLMAVYIAGGIAALFLLYGIFVIVRMTIFMNSNDPAVQEKAMKKMDAEEIGSKLAIKRKGWRAQMDAGATGKVLVLTPGQVSEYRYW